jgi:hypothetical protein
MDFLRRLFGGGSSANNQRYLVYYVQPKRCSEVLPVRVDRYNDLSEQDDGGFFVRKLVRGERCPFPSELHITFDKRRQPTDITVVDGEQRTEDEYAAFIAGRPTQAQE